MSLDNCLLAVTVLPVVIAKNDKNFTAPEIAKSKLAFYYISSPKLVLLMTSIFLA